MFILCVPLNAGPGLYWLASQVCHYRNISTFLLMCHYYYVCVLTKILRLKCHKYKKQSLSNWQILPMSQFPVKQTWPLRCEHTVASFQILLHTSQAQTLCQQPPVSSWQANKQKQKMLTTPNSQKRPASRQFWVQNRSESRSDWGSNI